ncbi:uncharacterized protein STEHIDRAFT_161734 [Stereum hirsutum FP-91666 SS1]|uniref:uncharacterized protein n=1 Tax=Stereum hirsutum (strain FP-91666) TaxID=721885 RepID=UPI00044499E4|nr:uncharacterized protein STEHIDRAFT_161734 [Stereum hirsutum FP-91666 SS1]EIM81549.1 hypothetical protein STEHIDRAFT_161734 [Stereum hirsutum FP-91666 SS1]
MSFVRDISDSIDGLLAHTLPVCTRAQLQELDHAILRVIADVRQTLNDRCPLAHSERHIALRATPNEVLSYIFLHLRGYPEDEDTPDPSWVNVLLVCRRWHRVAIDTPSLWRDLNFGRMPIDTSLQYIHRHKSLPFFVWSPTLDAVSSLTSTYPSFSHQLSRLVIQSPPDFGWLSPVNLPNLEELWVSSYTGDVSEDRASTSLSDFGVLRLINVTGLKPAWSIKPFPRSVQELSLDVTDVPWRPSSSQLHDCLEDLCNLRSFTLVGYGLIHSPNVDRLILSAIEYIYVTLPYADLDDLVRFIPIQNSRPYSLFLRGPRIQVHADDPGLHSLFHAHLRPVVFPRSLPYTSIHISKHGDLRSFILRDADELELSLPISRTSWNINPLLDLVGVVDIKHVCIEEDRGLSVSTRPLALHDIVPFLPNATSLTIQRQVGVEARAILVGLGHPDGQDLLPSAETYRLKWPCLNAITLEDIGYPGIRGRPAPVITQLRQFLMSVRTGAPLFQKLKIVRCSIGEEDVHGWREFIPEVEIVQGDPMESYQE